MTARFFCCWFLSTAIAGTVFASLCGCSKSPDESSRSKQGIKALGIVYGKYVSAHRGRRPASETELRQYATSKETSLLSQLGVSDPATMFVSPRDGLPLTVAYGTSAVTESNPIAGYESQPTGGKRWVVWTTGALMEVDEAEFQTIQPQP